MECSYLKKSLTLSQSKAFLETIDNAHLPLRFVEEAGRLKVPEILKDSDKVITSEHYWMWGFTFALMNSKLCWLPT